VLWASAQDFSDPAPLTEPDGKAWIVQLNIEEVAGVRNALRLTEQTHNKGLFGTERDATDGELFVRDSGELRSGAGGCEQRSEQGAGADWHGA